MQAATILIIADNPGNVDVIAEYLRTQGLAIMTARSGEDGLTKARQGRPELILLDVLLPQMDGFETCRQLQADDATKEIPVIFLIEPQNVSAQVQSFAVGGVDYLTKPIQQAEMIARVQTHLTLQQLQQHLAQTVAEQTADLLRANAQLRQEIAAQKQAEDRLRASEIQYRQLYEDAPHAYFRIGADAAIRQCNPAACRLLGYTGAELLQLQVFDLYADTPDGLPKARVVFQRVLKGEQIHDAELQMRRKDGSVVWISLSAVPVQDHAGQIIETHSMIFEIPKQKRDLKQEMMVLKAAIKDRWKLGEIIGKSPAMQQVYELITKAAAQKVNVMIYGDTGVGKELVARTIHQLSTRREQPLVTVNCGAITETLFEREFFGHRKGAFTGADRDHDGFFASAHHGTLFLDEIGEISPAMQTKLLRAIETGEYTPIGDTHLRKADVRIIAATNRNPDEMRQNGTMRKDFYYRVCVLLITVPPLRERREDIPLLIDHFLTQYSPNSPHEGIPQILHNSLCAYDWPGNVRQLQTMLQHYLAVGHVILPPTDEPIPAAARSASPSELLPGIPPEAGLLETLAQVEKQLILKALRQTSGRKEHAADLLGINRKTLYKKMKQHGL